MSGPTAAVTPGLLRDRVIFAAVVVLSAYVLLVPTSPGVPIFRYADKVVHFVVFAALAWSGRNAGIRAVPMGAALVLYAVASEAFQAVFLPRRSGGVTDALADVVGVAVGLLAAHAQQRRRARLLRQPDPR